MANLRNAFLFVFLVTLSPEILADRYGLDDDLEYSGGGGLGIFGFIGCLIAIGVSYRILFLSYTDWRARKRSGEKIERDGSFLGVVLSIVGYSVAAFFMSTPIVFVIKAIGGIEAVKDYWLYAGLPFFLALAFLRQT